MQQDEIYPNLPAQNEAERLAKMGHWELDIPKNTLYWSDGMHRLFEKERDEFGASYDYFLSIIHPEDRDLVNDAYTCSLENKTDYEITHRLLFPGNRIKYVVETCTTEFDNDGNPVRSIGTTQDVTEKTELQNEAKDMANKLIASNKIASMGTMAANICHEINNPLMGISTGLDRLRDCFSNKCKIEDINENIFDYLDEAIERINSVTAGLKSFMHPGEGDLGKINVEDFFNRDLNYLLPLYKKEGLDIQISIDDEIDFLVANKTELQQLILNALNNSRDALEGTDSPLVMINVTKKPNTISIEVSDNGTGIGQNVEEKAFNKFFTTKELGQGTGLGLNIAKKIMQGHNGEIHIFNNDRGGASLFLNFPDEDFESLESGSEGKSEDKEVFMKKGKRLLLVEDDFFIAENIKYHCENLGMKVIASNSADLALKSAEKEKYDVILSDQNLRGMQGGDFLSRLKKEHNFQGKMILMSGLPNLSESFPHFQIIQKPFSMSELNKFL